MTEIFGSIFAIGILLMIFRPVSRLTQSPVYWDIGLGTGAVIAFLIYLMTAIVTPAMIEEDLAREPCGSQSPQGVCYRLQPDLCRSLWEKSVSECKQELADIIRARPTGLIGPALNRCSARRMDKSIRFNRVQSDTPYCKAYFTYIEENQPPKSN